MNADFKFDAGLPEVSAAVHGVPLALGASAGAELATGAKLILAPRKYTVQAAQVSRSGMGFDYVFWRLERESFVEENDPGLRVVVRVPLPAERLQVSAEMVATRYPRLFGAGLRRAIKDLPVAMRDFFTGGTPIAATGVWDLSDEL